MRRYRRMLVTVDLKDILKMVFHVGRLVVGLGVMAGVIYWIAHGGIEKIKAWYLSMWDWAVRLVMEHKGVLFSTAGVAILIVVIILVIMDDEFF